MTSLPPPSSMSFQASAHYGRNVLGVEDFAALLSQLEVRKIGPGEVLFHEGEKGDCMYFLNSVCMLPTYFQPRTVFRFPFVFCLGLIRWDWWLSSPQIIVKGKVAVCSEKEKLGTLIILKPGAFFGESSLVTGNPRNATVGWSWASRYSVPSLVRSDFFFLVRICCLFLQYVACCIVFRYGPWHRATWPSYPGSNSSNLHPMVGASWGNWKVCSRNEHLYGPNKCFEPWRMFENLLWKKGNLSFTRYGRHASQSFFFHFCSVRTHIYVYIYTRTDFNMGIHTHTLSLSYPHPLCPPPLIGRPRRRSVQHYWWWFCGCIRAGGWWREATVHRSCAALARRNHRGDGTHQREAAIGDGHLQEQTRWCDRSEITTVQRIAQDLSRYFRSYRSAVPRTFEWTDADGDEQCHSYAEQ